MSNLNLPTQTPIEWIIAARKDPSITDETMRCVINSAFACERIKAVLNVATAVAAGDAARHAIARAATA